MYSIYTYICVYVYSEDRVVKAIQSPGSSQNDWHSSHTRCLRVRVIQRDGVARVMSFSSESLSLSLPRFPSRLFQRVENWISPVGVANGSVSSLASKAKNRMWNSFAIAWNPWPISDRFSRLSSRMIFVLLLVRRRNISNELNGNKNGITSNFILRSIRNMYFRGIFTFIKSDISITSKWYLNKHLKMSFYNFYILHL